VSARAASLAAALAIVASLPTPVRADPARGARVFQRWCACRSVVAGEDKLPDPGRGGVPGERACDLAGVRHSPERGDEEDQTPEAMPQDWTRVRDQGEYAHAARFVLQLSGPEEAPQQNAARHLPAPTLNRVSIPCGSLA
jgi:hypothetical protein